MRLYGPSFIGRTNVNISESQISTSESVEDAHTASFVIDASARFLIRSSWRRTLPYATCVILLFGLFAGCDALVGPDGETGQAGPRGETGPQGEIGPRGEIGLQGERGTRGEQGPPGETGPQGERGPRGERGPQGEQGPQGDTGPSGADGTNAIVTRIFEFERSEIEILDDDFSQIVFEILEIDSDVYDSGTVNAFLETADGWTALPAQFQIPFIHSSGHLISGLIQIGFSYFPGTFKLHFSVVGINPLPRDLTPDGRLKVIIISPV